MPMPKPGTACRAGMKGPVGTEDSSGRIGNVYQDQGALPTINQSARRRRRHLRPNGAVRNFRTNHQSPVITDFKSSMLQPAASPTPFSSSITLASSRFLA